MLWTVIIFYFLYFPYTVWKAIYIFNEITLERSLINYTIPVSIEVRRSKVDTQLRFKVITKYVYCIHVHHQHALHR